MRNLTNPAWIKAKGGLFLLLGVLACGLILIQYPTMQVGALLIVAVWAFCRFYYFAFYVIEQFGGDAMKISLALFCALLLTTHMLCQAGPGFSPKRGYVPDSDTAVRIAEAVLVPVYGKKQIESEQPFTASLKDDVWTVEGTLRCPDGKGGVATECDGGVAVVRISKKDGRILYMLHGM